jgi:RiboL-PSP-HEPN
VLHQLAFKHATKPVRKLAYLLDKSTYVLVASLWEAYCEDVATECLNHIAVHAPTYQSLPPSIIEDIQKNIRSGKGSPWDLAGDGWREYIRQRGKGYEIKRNKDFAGPKSGAVEQFFLRVLGVEDLCGRWQSSGSPLICDELDKHLDRRNTLVHRFNPGRVVNKQHVKEFYKTVWRLVACTDGVADEFLTRTTGESRWTAEMAADTSQSATAK